MALSKPHFVKPSTVVAKIAKNYGRPTVLRAPNVTGEVFDASAHVYDIKLFGNRIAEFQMKPGERTESGLYIGDPWIYLTDAGHETVTTKRYLNDILSSIDAPIGIWQKNYVWYFEHPETKIATEWSGSLLIGLNNKGMYGYMVAS